MHRLHACALVSIEAVGIAGHWYRTTTPTFPAASGRSARDGLAPSLAERHLMHLFLLELRARERLGHSFGPVMQSD
jgi:hypothetical protein